MTAAPGEAGTLYTVATAHLDTQWLWTIQDTIREFVPRTLRDNFERFEKYPHYVFNFEGAFRYMLAKEYYPADYARLKQYIAAGRWHVTGSAIDAGDTNIPAPESLIRHVLYANHFFKREFDKTSSDIFLPDCFGFGYALPTVAAHCGLKGFSTQKLTWGSSVGIPFGVGVWEGVDGSGLVAALDPGEYVGRIREDLSTNTEWIGKIEKLGRESGAPVGYKYYGTGDQGGAPDDESVAWLEKSLAGSGPLRVLSAFSDRMYADLSAAQIARLPRYNGELLMTRHGTGCYTSQAAMKRWNRKNEQLAAAAERASVAADWLGGAVYPRGKLTDAWVRVLWHHHHDDLTGTSTPLAYPFSWNDEAVSMNAFAAVLADAAGAVTRALDTRPLAPAVGRRAATPADRPGLDRPGDSGSRRDAARSLELVAHPLHVSRSGSGMHRPGSRMDGSARAVRALESRTGAVPVVPLVVFNPLAFEREDVVEASVRFTGALPGSVRVFGPDGREVPSQVLARIPARALGTPQAADAAPSASALRTAGTSRLASTSRPAGALPTMGTPRTADTLQASRARRATGESQAGLASKAADTLLAADTPQDAGALQILFLARVPSVGFAVYEVRPSEQPCALSTGLAVSTGVLENTRYRVRLDADGDVASVHDARLGRELLAAPARLQLLADAPEQWPEWEVSYADVMRAPRAYVAGPVSSRRETLYGPHMRVVERGPVRVAVEVSRQAGGSTFTQRIRLSAAGAANTVEFDTRVDWQSPRTLLKAAFPLTVSNPKATYDLGLGTLARGNNHESLYEVPAQQWADITSEDGLRGVAILNDCKYGWDKPRDDTLRLSLVHGPLDIEKDRGPHHFVYALAGHTGDWREGGVQALAARLNQPLLAFQTRTHAGPLGRSFSMLALSTPQVTLGALKKAEDDDEIIVRLFEAYGREAPDVRVTLAAPILSAREVTGAEEPLPGVGPGRAVEDRNGTNMDTTRTGTARSETVPGPTRAWAGRSDTGPDTKRAGEDRSEERPATTHAGLPFSGSGASAGETAGVLPASVSSPSHAPPGTPDPGIRIVDGSLHLSMRPYRPRTIALRLAPPDEPSTSGWRKSTGPAAAAPMAGPGPAITATSVRMAVKAPSPLTERRRVPAPTVLPGLHLTPPTNTTVTLPFDTDVISLDEDRTDGDFDGSGHTLPGELLPAMLESEGIRFVLGPRSPGARNALACKGQTLALPAGAHNRLYILAAAARGDTSGVFGISAGSMVSESAPGKMLPAPDGRLPEPGARPSAEGGPSVLNASVRSKEASPGLGSIPGSASAPGSRFGLGHSPIRGKDVLSLARSVPLTIQDFTGYVGQSQSLVVDGRIVPADRLEEPFTKTDTIAWVGTHRHGAKEGNEPYVFCYLFKYRIDLPRAPELRVTGVTGVTTVANVPMPGTAPAPPGTRGRGTIPAPSGWRLTLPRNESIRILAITLATNLNDDTVPASELSDEVVSARIRPKGGLAIEPVTVTLSSDRADAVLRYTLSGGEPSASDALYSGPFTIDKDTTVRARAFLGERALEPVAVRAFRFTTPRPAQSPGRLARGLDYQCFEGAWRAVAGFAALAAVKSGVADSVTLAPRTRDLDFGMTFSGYVEVPRDGVYTFFTRSDDGSTLWIGETLVVDNDGLHGSAERSGSIALAAGTHPLRVLFFQRGGDLDLEVSYEGPGISRQPLPASALWRPE